MPKKRFSDEQIAFALRQAEAGTTVGEEARSNPRPIELIAPHAANDPKFRTSAYP